MKGNLSLLNPCILSPPKLQEKVAELWGIITGLNLAWQKNYKKVIIETDSVFAKELSLSDGSSFNYWKPFVDNINMLRNKDWMTEIRDIPRDENRVADLLAKSALDIPFGEQVMEEAPDVCNFALYKDWEGCDLPLSFVC
ncbi:ribonuclease H [Senna tora]|uniref:Ribonuclease H n=1 Tax=Senna tora TaxID=362788 RepID=A0A835CDR2_9FABA|nr:ribonuclease H [Senna tora]